MYNGNKILVDNTPLLNTMAFYLSGLILNP